MKHAYVTAFVESILSGVSVEEALVRLRTTLQARGHSRLWSQVLKGAMRELEAKLKSHIPQVVLADESAAGEATIKSALAKLGAAEAEYSTTVDSTLIGGFTALANGQLLDQSYKRTLIELYRKITK